MEWRLLLYSRTCLDRPPLWPQKCGLSRQVVFVIGSVILKCRSFCQKCVACQNRWSLMEGVSQERFHCSAFYMWIHCLVIYEKLPGHPEGCKFPTLLSYWIANKCYKDFPVIQDLFNHTPNSRCDSNT